MTTASRTSAVDRAVQAASSYEEYAPPSDLAAAVACTWIARVGASPLGLDPVIPDACSDIIVSGDAEPHIAGPATRTHDVRLTPGSVVVGIRFKPGAARAAFGCDATELLDAHVDLRDVCGRGAASLIDVLRASPSGTHARDAMTRWARGRLQRTALRDEQLIRAARQLVIEPRLTMSELGDGLGWSVRRLHREFTAACGYSPKYLQRVLRMQRALRRARANASRPAALSSLALDAGYADQAHMSRDFKDLTGFTPRTLLARSTHDVGCWLDDD